MNPLVGILVLILLALLGARFSFRAGRVPEGPRLLFRTGTHFLVFGFLLGPAGLGLLTVEATRQLSPLLALGLGWVGFHFGLQLDRRNLAHFPVAWHVVALGQAVLSFLLFLGGGWLILSAAGASSGSFAPLILIAAATAAVTTPAGIAMVSSNFMVRGSVRDLLFFIGSLDAVVGIVALQVTYALFRPVPGAAAPALLPQPMLNLVAAGLGLVLGILFLWLVRRRPTGEELMLYILGMSAFGAGAALQWGLSPLFVSVAMGALVANGGPGSQRVFRILQRWEKPVYLTFLLLAGVLLSTPTRWLLLLAGGYALLRTAAKTAGAAALVALVPLGFHAPRRLGLGLVPQGGISLAMAAGAALMYPDLRMGHVGGEGSLFTVIVIGVMLSELTGPFFTVKLLRRAGEISAEVEHALERGDTRRAERAALRRKASSTSPPGGGDAGSDEQAGGSDG
jgi:hypothetical protein